MGKDVYEKAAERLKALDELAQLSQDIGMYDDKLTIKDYLGAIPVGVCAIIMLNLAWYICEFVIQWVFPCWR